MRCELNRHFVGSFKKLMVKYRLGLLFVGLLISMVFCLAPKPYPVEVTGLPFGHPILKPELSCEQVLKLAEWGRKKYGGLGQTDLFSFKQASRVAEIFADKLDPNRMLITASELEQLKAMTQLKWNRLTQKADCEPWQQWLENRYPKSQQRIALWLKKYKEPRKLKREKISQYSTFAASERELEQRWVFEFNSLLAEADNPLLKAYQEKKKLFLKDRLEQKYFETGPESRNLLAKALLGGLDSYSTYFSPVEFEDFYEELKGSASGLGLKLQKVPKGFLVEKVIENSSAQRSQKIHAGDTIEKIDDVILGSISFDEAKKLLKGPESSSVKLGLNCNHSEVQEKFIELVLERTPFELEESKVSFAWKSPKTDPQKSSKVAVVAVPAFYGRGGIETGTEEKSVSEDFQHRVREALLTETDHTGMVLDLRGNPGGYLEEAVSLGAFFVGNKPIVGVLEEGKTRVLKNPSSNQTVYHRPLVVLVDESSASAAEVLTGALKDYQRAIVVGSSRTYGKGTVQRLFQLEDPFLFASEEGVLGTGVIKLTTSVFYSPLGHTPANGGVSTDIVLNDKLPQVNQKSLAHEILPIVDVELKSELQLSELKHQDQIEFLRGKSKERMETSTGLVEDKDLEEAIAIVSDLAHLDSF